MVNRLTRRDALIERLNARLREWEPETAAEVRERVMEIIGLADQDVLDLLRSRSVEQDVLDILDAPTPSLSSRDWIQIHRERR